MVGNRGLRDKRDVPWRLDVDLAQHMTSSESERLYRVSDEGSLDKAEDAGS